MRAHQDRLSIVCLGLAALWSAALIVLAVSFAGSGSTSEVISTTGHSSIVHAPALTLVQENGLKVLLPVGLPLLAAVVVAVALGWRRHHGRRGPGPVALGATIVVGVLSLVGVLTIGPFLLPVVVFLVLACARASAPGAALLHAPSQRN